MLEGQLPSKQPEVFLKEEQIYNMSKRGGVNKIIDEILRSQHGGIVKHGGVHHDNKLMQKTSSSGQLQQRVTSSTGNKPPRALKTNEFSSTEIPRSPYRGGDEMGRIIGYGIPAGAGYPIPKRYSGSLDSSSSKNFYDDVMDDDEERLRDESILSYMSTMKD